MLRDKPLNQIDPLFAQNLIIGAKNNRLIFYHPCLTFGSFYLYTVFVHFIDNWTFMLQMCMCGAWLCFLFIYFRIFDLFALKSSICLFLRICKICEFFAIYKFIFEIEVRKFVLSIVKLIDYRTPALIILLWILMSLNCKLVLS